MPRKMPWRSLLLRCGFFLLTIQLGSWAIALSSHERSLISSSSTASPAFEVASIKQTNPKQHIVNALLTYPGARVVAIGATLHFLLTEAYNLSPAQIIGGPKWIRKTRFDIEAKPRARVAQRYLHVGAPKDPPPPEVRYMLRNLLIKRFRLKLHSEQKRGTVYEIVRNGKPLHLNPSKNKNEFSWAGGVGGGLPSDDGLRGENITMNGLAARLSLWLSEPVVDHTGLSGRYDFKVVPVQTLNSPEMSLDENILESLRELGLGLKKSEGSVKTLVIDQAFFPTPN